MRCSNEGIFKFQTKDDSVARMKRTIPLALGGTETIITNALHVQRE